jgi:hypothetical protein
VTPLEYLQSGRIGRDAPSDPAAVAAAFELVVQRRFGPECAVAEITRSVAAARPARLIETEMLVRAALGETVPVADIPSPEVLAAQVLMFRALVDELALTDAEVAGLIRR